MSKAILFVFNGDPMCFIHVLLNALELHARGQYGRIVIEGAATRLVAELPKPDHPLHGLWEKARAVGLVEGVCRACAQKMGSLAAAQEQKLTLLDDMNGHPSMARFREAGYDLITF
jgi:hypothetical protein